MSSGHMNLCTFFGIWDTDRALANYQHPSIFGTLAIIALQCSFMILTLVSKFKLYTWVLKYSKYSSTPWGYSDTWVLHVVLLKVLIFLVVVALDHPNSLACHIHMTFKIKSLLDQFQDMYWSKLKSHSMLTPSCIFLILLKSQAHIPICFYIWVTT